MAGRRMKNPETGEVVEFSNGNWVPVPASPKGQSADMSFFRAMSGKLLENVGNIPAAMAGGVVDAAMNPNPFAQRKGPAPGVSYGDVVSQMAPSSDQIFAQAQRAGEKAAQIATGSDMPISTTPQALANQQRITQQNQQNNPFWSGAGEVAGDIGTLLSFRAPMAKNRAALDHAQSAGVRALEQARVASQGNVTPAANSFKELFGNGFARSPFAASITRGTTKAAEAGFDGLMLGIMDRQDPIETAAIGAGTQVGSSLMLSALTGFKGTGSPSTRLAIAAAGTMGVLQVLRIMTPMDEASPVADLQAAFPKIVATTLLGLGMGVMGGGRVTGTKAFEGSRNLLPVLMDQAQTAVRGISLETLNGWMADPRIEPTLNALISDPDTFGPAAGRRIERAITHGNISLSNTLDELSRNPRFRNTMESLQQ